MDRPGIGALGLEIFRPNSNVATLKSFAWNDLLNLLGKDGDKMMLDLVLHCGIFATVQSGRDNLVQISGTRLNGLVPLKTQDPVAGKGAGGATGAGVKSAEQQLACRPGEIAFVRARLLYARPILDAQDQVHLGLRCLRGDGMVKSNKQHGLDGDTPRSEAEPQDHERTVTLMKHIFPRQFKMHNVFTFKLGRGSAKQAPNDYAVRKKQIVGALDRGRWRHGDKHNQFKLPKRLRGRAAVLIGRLRKLHFRCSYTELLRYYCPADVSSRRSGDLVDAATPFAKVIAFSQAVLAKVWPRELFGAGDDGERNWRLLLQSVDRFVRCRRHETLTLHGIVQGMRLNSIAWLDHPETVAENKRPASDTAKRTEIFQELLYYIFDSFLMPLLRSNFYITESSTDRYRLFYFRHDVWRQVTASSVATLQESMLHRMSVEKAKRILKQRGSGHAQVRLVPKGTGVRPIMNLGRKAMVARNGNTVMGRSINDLLKPAHSMLTYERHRQPEMLASSVFCVNDIFPRLRQFRSMFPMAGGLHPPFYFVKVDVRSCFDTIPQHRMLEFIESLCSEKRYRFVDYTHIKFSGRGPSRWTKAKRPKAFSEFLLSARAGDNGENFGDMVDTDFARNRRRSVFFENVGRGHQDRDRLLGLLRDLMERNILKMDKRFYLQKEGIPQGSAVSALLCSFFYADFERQCLSFLDEQSSLLLRLIDDFLLITTDRAQAHRFMRTMAQGSEAYGIRVRMHKSLVNFECNVDGENVPRVQAQEWFPYCGTLIDTRTLEMTRERRQLRDRSKDWDLHVGAFKFTDPVQLLQTR